MELHFSRVIKELEMIILMCMSPMLNPKGSKNRGVSDMDQQKRLFSCSGWFLDNF